MPKTTDSYSASGPEGAGYMTPRLLSELRALVAEHLPAELYELRRILEVDADDPTGRKRADFAELKPRAAAFEGYLINCEGDTGFLLSAYHQGADTMEPTLLPSLSAVILAIRERVTPPPSHASAVAA